MTLTLTLSCHTLFDINPWHPAIIGIGGEEGEGGGLLYMDPNNFACPSVATSSLSSYHICQIEILFSMSQVEEVGSTRSVMCGETANCGGYAT